jgi:hypothetical protein
MCQNPEEKKQNPELPTPKNGRVQNLPTPKNGRIQKLLPLNTTKFWTTVFGVSQFRTAILLDSDT